MNAPLSGKQHREFLKLAAQEQRENVKMEREESRKQALHEIKLQEAAGGANQKLGHKEQVHQTKLQDLRSPLASRTQQPRPNSTDTVPAMLTPGEAVIPRSAAQDPKNIDAIRKMVAEGRRYEHGTTDVPDFNRGSSNIPGYQVGTTKVSHYTPQYQRQLFGAESRYDPIAKNTNSTASGYAQFLEKTYNNLRIQNPESIYAKVPFRSKEFYDIENQKAALKDLTEANGNYLARRKIPINFNNLYAAHWLGPEAAAKVIQSENGASLETFLTQEVLDANPTLKGITVGDYKNILDQKMGGKAVREPKAVSANVPPAGVALSDLKAPPKSFGDRFRENLDKTLAGAAALPATSLEVARSIVQNTGAAVAGFGAGAAGAVVPGKEGQGAEWLKSTEEKLGGFKPDSKAGNKIMDVLGWLPEKLDEYVAKPLGDALTKAGYTTAGSLVRSGVNLAPLAAAAAIPTPKGAVAKSVKVEPTPAKGTPTKGVKVEPTLSDAPPPPAAMTTPGRTDPATAPIVRPAEVVSQIDPQLTAAELAVMPDPLVRVAPTLDPPPPVSNPSPAPLAARADPLAAIPFDTVVAATPEGVMPGARTAAPLAATPDITAPTLAAPSVSGASARPPLAVATPPLRAAASPEIVAPTLAAPSVSGASARPAAVVPEVVPVPRAAEPAAVVPEVVPVPRAAEPAAIIAEASPDGLPKAGEAVAEAAKAGEPLPVPPIVKVGEAAKAGEPLPVPPIAAAVASPAARAAKAAAAVAAGVALTGDVPNDGASSAAAVPLTYLNPEGEPPPAAVPPALPTDPPPAGVALSDLKAPQQYPDDWYQTLGIAAQDRARAVAAAKATADKLPPAEQKSFLERAISSIFGGEDSLFQPQDLARFAMVAAGGMITGGSVGGSLKYAGLDVLKHADARNLELAKQKKLIEAQKAAVTAENVKNIRELEESTNTAFIVSLNAPHATAEAKKTALSIANREANTREEKIANYRAATAYMNAQSNSGTPAKDAKEYLKSTADEMYKLGSLNYEAYRQVKREIFEGNLTDADIILNRKDVGTPEFYLGIKPGDKPLHIAVSGRSGTVPGSPDPANPGHFLILSKTPNGGVKVLRTIDDKKRTYLESSPSANSPDEDIKRTMNGLNKSLFTSQKSSDGKDLPPRFLKGSEGGIDAQLREWKNNRRRLDQDDEVAPYATAINGFLNIAAKSKDKEVNIGKMLDLAVINVASLTDTNKITVRDKPDEAISAARIGEAVKEVTSPFNNGKSLSRFKNPTEFLDEVSSNFEKDRGKVNVKTLLSGVDNKSRYYNLINEAPNDWWAYVYRNLYNLNKEGK